MRIQVLVRPSASHRSGQTYATIEVYYRISRSSWSYLTPEICLCNVEENLFTCFQPRSNVICNEITSEGVCFMFGLYMGLHLLVVIVVIISAVLVFSFSPSFVVTVVEQMIIGSTSIDLFQLLQGTISLWFFL